MKKILLSALNLISVILIMVSVVILLTVLMARSGEVPNLFGYSAFRVATGSMEPELPVGALIVTRKTDPEAIREGDVITFYSRDPALNGATNTHRVVGIEENGGQRIFHTKGDANPVEDAYVTLAADVVGVVVGSSLPLGRAIRLLSNPLVFFPLLIAPLVVLLVVNLWSAVRAAQKIAREEEEAAIQRILKYQRMADQDPGEEPEPDEDIETEP